MNTKEKRIFSVVVVLMVFALMGCRATQPYSESYIPAVHYPSQDIEFKNLASYSIAHCWRPSDAPHSVAFPEQQGISIVVSDGAGDNRYVTNVYPTSSPAFVYMLGCLSEDRQGMRWESGKLAWRPGRDELTMVYGTNPALTNFKFFTVLKDMPVDDLGDPVGQNDYFINPDRVFWSPDGGRFATLATDRKVDEGLGTNIWIYDMDTSKILRVSNIEKAGNSVVNATWSVHGDKIAVGYGVPHSGIAISTYGEETYIEITSEHQSALSDWPFVVDNVLEIFSKDSIFGFNLYIARSSLPLWVNDDSQVMFVASNINKQATLFTVNSDGTGLHELLPGFPGIVALPTLAPDGKTLAYVRYPDWKDRSRVEIATLDMLTMETNSLVVLPAPANGDELIISGLSWTSDSNYLAFSSPHTGESEIYVVSRDGRSWVNITEGFDGDAVSPAWKP